ncbi:MAG: hypothetical protein WC516_05730 [Patescibacteria group bacterium]|jgi:hypothetical protein
MSYSVKLNPFGKWFQWVTDSVTVAWADITGKPTWVASTEESFTTALKNKLDAIVDPLVYKGVIDCSGSPNYPAASTGHVYRVSVAGKIGGASGVNVEINDALICNTTSVAGDQATVGINWNIVQSNIDGAVTGPASSVDSNIAEFDSTSGKIIKDGSLSHVNVSSAISLKHTQGTDQGLDTGGVNEVSAAQAKAGYTHSGVVTGNPHSVTKSDVGLSNVDNKSEATIITDVKADSDVSSAISLKHTQNTDTGTTQSTFQIDSGNTGPKIKNNSGVVEHRNAADNADADVKGKDLVASGEIGDGTNKADPITILTSGLEYMIDGGGAEIADGIAGWLEVPFDCTIKACRLFADQAGAIKLDIWKDTYANYPPNNDNTITGANEPEISASGVKDEDTTLTSWTTSLSKGDVLYFNVDSCTTIQKCLVSLTVQKR